MVLIINIINLFAVLFLFSKIIAVLPVTIKLTVIEEIDPNPV